MSKKSLIPKGAITERQLRKLLKAATGKDSFSEFAKAQGMTPQVISAFMRKVQSPGLQIPKALGYFPQTIYMPIGTEPITTANPQRRPTANPTSKTDPTKPPIEKKGVKSVDPKIAIKEKAQSQKGDGKKKKDKKKK